MARDIQRLYWDSKGNIIPFERILGDKAGRYVNTNTGEVISRRQGEKLVKPQQLAVREKRYKERKQLRRTNVGRIKIERQTEDDNKRYWRQRWAEQYAVKNGITDVEALELSKKPGSRFNKLYAAAESEGFDGGDGSAWDYLTWEAGAKGGSEDADERSKYIAVLSWYMSNKGMASEGWVDRSSKGRFTYPASIERR